MTVANAGVFSTEGIRPKEEIWAVLAPLVCTLHVKSSKSIGRFMKNCHVMKLAGLILIYSEAALRIVDAAVEHFTSLEKKC